MRSGRLDRWVTTELNSPTQFRTCGTISEKEKKTFHSMQIVSERGTTPSDWNAQKDSSCFTRGRQAHSDPGASDGALSNRALQKPPRSPGQLIHPPPPTPAVQPLALEHQPLQRWRTAIRKCSQHGRKKRLEIRSHFN